MEIKIAAFTCEGALSSIEDCTDVLLFEKQNGVWIMTKQFSFRLEGGNPAEIRDSVRSLILELGNCSMVVSTSIAGIPYYVFDRMGFSVFEANLLSCELLDDLLREVELEQRHIREEGTATEPVPLDDEGRWFMDLISLQEKHPEISSKQALRPFLQKKNFFELKLLCTHFPPWMELDISTMHLGYAIESNKNGQLEVVISHILCKG
jgi:Fe-only nitrogenase accessory protein AnfO